MPFINTNELRESERKNLEFLCMTRFIIEEEHPHDILNWLAGCYRKQDNTDSVVKAVHSVINSILTQERVVFALSRRGIKELMRGDKNHPQPCGFRDSLYTKILQSLYSWGIIKKIVEGRTSGFEVIEPNILAFLNRKIDTEKQRSEVVKFCSNINKGTNVGTNVGTSPGTKELKNIRNKETKKERTNGSLQEPKKTSNEETFQDTSTSASTLGSSLNQEVSKDFTIEHARDVNPEEPVNHNPDPKRKVPQKEKGCEDRWFKPAVKTQEQLERDARIQRLLELRSKHNPEKIKSDFRTWLQSNAVDGVVQETNPEVILNAIPNLYLLINDDYTSSKAGLGLLLKCDNKLWTQIVTLQQAI